MSAHIKALVGVLLAGSLIAGLLWYFYPAAPERVGPPLDAIEKMRTTGVPEFQLEDLEGHRYDLAAHAGHIVIINFWASWCEPCVEEVPSLVNLIQKMKGRVELVAISGDSDRQEIESFLKSFQGLKAPGIWVLWDKNKKVVQSYGVERLPETFIIGPDHKLIKKLVGSIHWDQPDSLAYFENLLK